jgi:hypothetical protein
MVRTMHEHCTNIVEKGYCNQKSERRGVVCVPNQVFPTISFRLIASSRKTKQTLIKLYYQTICAEHCLEFLVNECVCTLYIKKDRLH